MQCHTICGSVYSTLIAGSLSIFDATVTEISRQYHFLKTEIGNCNDQKRTVVVGPAVTIESTLNYPLHTAQMIIGTDSTGVYFRFEVLFAAIEVGRLPANKIRLQELLSSLDPNASYNLCLGLPADSGELMGFHSKSLHE